MAALDDLWEQIERLRGEKRDLEQLVETPGWLAMEKALIANVQARRQRDFSEGIDSLDGAFRSATARGEIAGVEAARLMPMLLMADLDYNLDAAITELEEMDRDD